MVQAVKISAVYDCLKKNNLYVQQSAKNIRF